VIALLLAASLLSGGEMPPDKEASWYGWGGECYGGKPRTCSPYLSGSQDRYCAVGWWRWKRAPYDIMVRSLESGMVAICTVRDYCEACAKRTGGRYIDLAPAVFLSLGHSLGKGVIEVEVINFGGR
jgi:hypothetical protein